MVTPLTTRPINSSHRETTRCFHHILYLGMDFGTTHEALATAVLRIHPVAECARRAARPQWPRAACDARRPEDGSLCVRDRSRTRAGCANLALGVGFSPKPALACRRGREACGAKRG